MNFNNLDDIDQYSNGIDHGFDPPQIPQKIDSGRGGTASMTGGGYRNGEGVQMQQNHMFDIEEDNEDQFDHYNQ